MPVELFFPEPHSGPMPRDVVDVCERCSVSAECLGFALKMERGVNHRAGLWGGLTPRARRELA